MKIWMFTPLFLLAACGEKPNSAGSQPVIVPVEVGIAKPAPCVPDDLKAEPDYVDTNAALLAAGGPDERYQLLWAGRSQRVDRLNEIEPIIKACPRGKSK